MYLSPALAGLLRNAVVAHVGNLEDEGLNIQRDWILYSIFLSRTSYFLVVPPEDCRGNINNVSRKGSEKEHETGVKETGQDF